MAGRLFRTEILGFVVIMLFAGALAWQANVAGTMGSVDPITANQTKIGAVASDAAKVFDQPRQTPIAAEPPAEAQPQLEAMGNDLAAMRRSVEQMVVRQDAMAHDVATLQADRESLNEKIESLNEKILSFRRFDSKHRKGHSP
jgi:hypothetical protein